MRHLHRPRYDGVWGPAWRWMNLQQFGFPFDGLFAPTMADELQRLFQLGGGQLGIDAAERHLLRGATSRRAEVEPAVGDHVEHRSSLGDARGMVVAERHTHGRVPDADARRARRDGGEEDLGRAHVRILDERVMFNCPYAVEAHLFRVDGLVDAVSYRLSFHVRCSEFDLGFEDHGKLHEDSPRCTHRRIPPSPVTAK